jgi:hypothetical protein
MILSRQMKKVSLAAFYSFGVSSQICMLFSGDYRMPRNAWVLSACFFLTP